MLERMEQLSRSGDKEGARRLLEQLQSMLENLRMARPRQGGEGDAQSARIYAEAANRDPGFYAFQRSLEAYRKSFAGGDSVIVLERDDPFLQYMRSDR